MPSKGHQWGDGSKFVTLDTEVMEKDSLNTYIEAKNDTFSPFATTGITIVRSAGFPKFNNMSRWILHHPEPKDTTEAKRDKYIRK